MAYVITQNCIDVNDRSCVDVCPVDCIYDVGRMLVIDPGECIDCGACEPACPVEAIFPQDAVPDELSGFIAINAAHADGAEQATALVERYAAAAELPPIPGYRG